MLRFHTSRSLVVVFFVLVTLEMAGCTSPGKTTTTTGGRNVIPLEEIQAGETRYANAYDLVRAVKPRWISNLRGDVRVFFNGFEYGGPESLRDFSLVTIGEVKYAGLRDSYRYVRSDRPTTVILVSSR